MSGEAAKLDSNALALDRTLLAHERTLMAWVRTSASMTSFAFTIYKFFQFENGNGSSGVSRGRYSPRDYAILMVSIGLVSLVLATIQFRRETRQLRTQISGGRFPLVEIVAILVSLFGLLVLTSAIAHQ